MSRDFVGALLQLNAEKQVSREALGRALEEGIQAAYRRVAGEEDIFVRVEPESGRIDVYRGRYVVDEIEDPMVEVTVDEARRTKDDAKAGDVIETIVATARGTRADLIVMTTDGRNGFLDALRGTHSERVLRAAPCPLLAIPATAFVAQRLKLD